MAHYTLSRRDSKLRNTVHLSECAKGRIDSLVRPAKEKLELAGSGFPKPRVYPCGSAFCCGGVLGVAGGGVLGVAGGV